METKEGSIRATLPWNRPIDQGAFEPLGTLTNPARIGCRHLTEDGSQQLCLSPRQVLRIKAKADRKTLNKRVSIGYTSLAMKDVGLRIRLQRDLREKFVAACKAEDKPAAQVLREFMRSYVDAHAPRARSHHSADHDNKQHRLKVGDTGQFRRVNANDSINRGANANKDKKI
ncbi:hypothetical protein [Pseudooceanicola nitratireducens]|uniref:hypothetical protein n=1 Tax=Pseudooceanicola nitratireducens TaxID=517719 RepID=UPI0023F45B04|nr:hypothetical protein [Pseudooceanicola nitratireducens]